MRSRVLLGIVAACATVTACDGLKEALTAHVDVVARAGSQELSVTRLGDLLGNAKIPVQVTRDNAAIIADIWTGFEQLGAAAAHGDSLNDKKAIDVAIAPIINNMKISRFMDSIAKTFKVDSGSEAAYDQAAGGLLAARHILIGFKDPSKPAPAAEKDSVRKKAMAVRAQVTPANFAEMAKKYSTDPSAAQNSGNLGVFPKGSMIAAFYDATAALKPGEISQPIETNFGYHIIQRLPYAEAKKDFDQQYAQLSARGADSIYMAQLDSSAHFQVRESAPEAIKNAVKDEAKYHDDRNVLATFEGGQLTTAEFLGWLETFPPQQQIAQRIPQAPDSILKPFIRSIAEREILLQRANAAKVDLKPEDRENLYNGIQQLVGNLWQALGVDPKMLADSAKTPAEKERLAASRVDSYLDRMMAGQAQVITVAPPLKRLLDAKYESSVNSTGIDRAFERAQKVRQSADSAKTASQPKSEIPLPGVGGTPGGTPPGQPQSPPPTAQPGTKKP